MEEYSAWQVAAAAAVVDNQNNASAWQVAAAAAVVDDPNNASSGATEPHGRRQILCVISVQHETK